MGLRPAHCEMPGRSHCRLREGRRPFSREASDSSPAIDASTEMGSGEAGWQ